MKCIFVFHDSDVPYAAQSIQRQSLAGPAPPNRPRPRFGARLRSVAGRDRRRHRGLAIRVPGCAYQSPSIDWPKVEAFHLDEYIGLPATHPGSFRKMLMEQLVRKTGIINFTCSTATPPTQPQWCAKWASNWRPRPSTSHFWALARTATSPSTIRPLTSNRRSLHHREPRRGCRRQQVGEGWFADISQVPKRAISMSARQILKAKEFGVVPDKRKAQAVKACFEGEISPMAPASILRRHSNATVYLDKNSASLLSPALQNALAEESQVDGNS